MIRMEAGSQKAILKISNINKLTVAGIQYASYTSGKMLVKATSKEILKRPKGGLLYIRRDRIGRRRRHIASAAGETHANMSGRLRGSLGFNVNITSLEFGYGVNKGDAPDYAPFVEFGTRNMKPRPSLQNGIKGQVRNFQNNFDREIGKRLEGRGF